MSSPGGALLAGVGSALAVALPVTLVAQILRAVSDDDLPPVAVVGLAIAVVAGAGVGGWAVHRRQAGWPVGAGAGSLALAAIALLGVVRRVAAGEEHGAATVLGAAVVGALAGGVGWALGLARAARTRP